MERLAPIHHTFAPLADGRQRLRALAGLLMPHRWLDGPARAELEQEVGMSFGAEAIGFGTGREGLLALLRALRIRPGEEVIVQGYTCVVVPNAVAAAGGTAVFADIDPGTLNLNLDEVRRLLSPRTRAIICQHTFGIPADTAGLRAICDEHQLALIEDCAHVLPDETGPTDVGGRGDFLLLSFGRDKAVSGVSGGMIVSRHKSLTQNLRAQQASARHLPRATVAKLLLYPLLYGAAKPIYANVGKALLAGAARLGLLPRIVSNEEKEGLMPPAVSPLPNALAALALDQWRRRRDFNDHRRILTGLWLRAGREHGLFGTGRPDDPLPAGVREGLPLQKLPLFVPDAQGIRRALKQRNIHLDDGWTGCVICPDSVHLENTGYQWGQDPEAERRCQQILSLPTHPTMTEAQLDELLSVLAPLFLHAHAAPPVAAPTAPSA
ncbi:MAG: DegT/DnrJ/EryC1/StrS family aminotransferase [Candidatus Peribacteraceae bacterium]|nr:DegT/DnrJ/EryC1/StrS family aminotransferase [Candidatus Peribacteraceae bacterium]